MMVWDLSEVDNNMTHGGRRPEGNILLSIEEKSRTILETKV